MPAYSPYPLEGIGRGIDTYAPKDKIVPGMLADGSMNIDAVSNDTYASRKGYERYFGNIPIRVNSITHSGTTITLELDSAQTLSLEDAGQGPLIIGGTIPASAGGSGDFSSVFNVVWYSNYSLSIMETFSSGAPATKTKTATTTGLTSANAFFEIAESGGGNDLSNTRISTDISKINKSSYQIDFDYYAYSSFTGFFYYLATPDTSSLIHVETFSSSSSVSIPNSTHALANLNFVIRCYEDDGTSLVEVEAASITLDTITGDVDVTFATAISGRIIIYATSTSYVASFAASPGDNTLTIPNVTDPFNFVSVWAQSGADLIEVTPGSIAYDASSKEMTISYTLGSGSETVEVYWVPASYQANILTVEDSLSTSESYTVNEPQLTIWGIPHDTLYKAASVRGGHVHHIDNYSTEGVEKVVCGLGGNLFEAYPYSSSNAYLLPSYRISGSNRIASDTDIAPLFATTGSTDSRSRTQITDDSVTSLGAIVTAVTYSGSGNLVDYTLSFINKSGTISIGSEVSTSDKLTVVNCGNNINNGSFTIDSIVSDSATETVVRVTNSNISSASYDETAIDADANVYTDILTITSNTLFVPGDQVSSIQLSGTHNVISATSTTLVIDGVTSSTSLANGANLYISRTSSIVPTQNSVSPDSDNLVRGDMVVIGTTNRRFRIKQATTFANASITVVVASGIATITKSAHYLNSGDKIFLVNASNTALNGEHTLTSASTTTTLVFTTSLADASYTATILGDVIEIDESISWTAGPTEVAVYVEGRWIPIENPGSTQARVQPSKQQHFDENPYSNQPYTKSVIVNDSMLLGNGDDEIKKYDGANLTNAGLPPFQCWCFLSVDTTSTALPAGQQVDFTNSDTSSTKKYFGIDVPLLSVGDRFKCSDTSEILTVSAVEVVPGSTDKYRVYTVEDFTSPSGDGQLIKANIYRFFVKVNLVDINNAIVSGPTLGADDLYAEVFSSSSILLSVLPLPAFEEIDYDRIEVEVYRTKANQVAPFYRVYRNLVDYGASSGPIIIEDTTPDEALTFADLDPTATSLTGGELGNTFYPPPKAEVVTTADNRLVLGKISSPPILDIAFRKAKGVASLTTSDFSGGEIRIQRTSSTDTSANADLAFSFETTGVDLLRSGWDFVDGDVDTGTDYIAETSHGLLTGDRVQLTTTATLPAGLSLSTDYFVIKVDDDNIQLATSFANAIAGTQVDITAASGGGTHTLTTFSNISAASGSFTINSPSHGLAANDVVYLFHSTLGETNQLDFAGWYRINAVTTHTFTILLSHSRSAGFIETTDVNYYCVSTSSTSSAANRIPIWIGTDGNLNQRGESSLPVEAIAASRMALAINFIMATEDSATNYWDTTLGVLPLPWILAQSGQSYPLGNIRVLQVEPNGSLTITPSGIGSNVSTFVNNLLLANDASDTSEIRLFNSRLVVSYPNFAEIFNDPYTTSAGVRNVIDVDPANGQDMAAAVPFFGRSAFGSAQLSQSVVVLKTASIYLVNVSTGEVQKLQTQGQGCTAPRSVTPTKNGICFANRSGIYRLGWDMSLSWLGMPVDGIWQSGLNSSQIAELNGHNSIQRKQYKLSYPIGTSSTCSEVVVYDHTREERNQPGSWSVYDNHHSTGWCNQQDREFWGSTAGRVYLTRDRNEVYDYRDDDEVISTTILFGAVHFGIPNSRKIVDHVTITFQNIGTITNCNVLTEQSLSGTFNDSGTVNIPSGTADATIRFSLPDRRGTHIRTKLTFSTKDEKLQISEVVYGVAGIGTGATKSAQQFGS